MINISSLGGVAAARGLLSYGTAKGALIDYTRLAVHDPARRIRVNAIAAGTIVTDATRVIADDAALRSEVEAVTLATQVGNRRGRCRRCVTPRR